MITLPVSSSVYQSMVANIQQIHTNGDGTLCITPMQVQKTGHQHSISHLNSTSISGSLIGSNCSVAPCISSVNSSFSNVSSGGASTPILANCQPISNSPYGTTSEMASSLNCDSVINNGNNNLLELCRVLSQTTNVNNTNCQSTLAFNNLSQNFTNNDRKVVKSKKIVNRNQFPNSTNFGQSGSYSNDSNGMDRNFMSQNIDENKTTHQNDTNNNNHSEENNGNANHDLKCAQILVSTVTEDMTKVHKSDNIPVTVTLNENDTRNIKMECEIDVA